MNYVLFFKTNPSPFFCEGQQNLNTQYTGRTQRNIPNNYYFSSSPEIHWAESVYERGFRMKWNNLEKVTTLLCVSLLSLTVLSPMPVYAISVGGDVVVLDPVKPKDEEEEEEVEPLFPDIAGHWAEEAITEAVGLGLFVGIDEESFAPDKNMTRAEFMVVLLTSIYPTADYSVTGKYWYSNYFETAYAEGFMPSTWRELYMDQPISRQEMAYMLANVVETEPEQWIKSSAIPDYGLVTKSGLDDYREAVLNVYSQGIMMGKETDGSFCPLDYATRAEGVVVVLNCLSEDKRVEVSFERDPNEMTDLNRLDLDYTKNRSAMTYSITDPDRPIAKVGDTVIISNKEYAVVAHPSGASYYGMYVPYVAGNALDAGINTYSTHGVVGHGFQGGGVHYNGEAYYINPNTKEGYWQSQWDAILKRNPSPNYYGSTEGEVSENLQWMWSESSRKWVEAYAYVKS